MPERNGPSVRKTVLVIDDDTFVRQLICEVVKNCDYDVLEAGDGDAGLAVIRENGLPDLVVTDIVMPGKDGFETIREIRAAYPAAKICAISGGGRSDTDDYFAKALQLGANAVLSKPMKFDELEQMLKRLIA